MDSRLDRLLILLDTGSSEAIRMAAAKQLGEVQKVQPNDFGYLLRRIKEYSSKSVWETRVAAGHATRFVIEQIKPWPNTNSSTSQTTDGGDSKNTFRLEIAQRVLQQNINIQQIIESFNLDKIMSTCPKLLSLKSTDDEDSSTSTSGLKSPPSSSRGSRGGRKRKESTMRAAFMKNDKDQLMRQRKLINKELGIMDSLNIGVKSTDIVSNDDLQTEFDSGGDCNPKLIHTKATSDPLPADNKRSATPVMISNYETALNLLIGSDCIKKESETKEEKPIQEQQSSYTPNVPSYSDSWPLLGIASEYLTDLFNPSWEIRHGAAIALREIVKKLGMCAGKRSDLDELCNSILNQLWLVDMALNSICVLALDKFGDFLFDQVVAPVRENAAQLFGCCIAYMSESYATSILQLLKKMLIHSNWETRHGGMLGLKYSMNVLDSSFSKKVLLDCFDYIFKCLDDSVDDVSGEAAAALVSVKDLMIGTIPDKTPKLIKFLWHHLANLDDLTSSTSNIVLLLASLITSSSSKLELSELEKSIPTLLPLLKHSSTSVRISVLRALKTLLHAQQTPCCLWLSEDLETTLLRLVLQRSVLENVEEVRKFIEDVWTILIQTDDNPASKFNLLKSTSKYLNYWLCLVMQPTNIPIDRGSEMWLNLAPDGSISSSKPSEEVYIASCTFNAETVDLQKNQVTKCRLFASKLLGALYATLITDSNESSTESQHSKETLKYLSEMFIHYIQMKSAHQRIISGWTLESWAKFQICLLDNNSEKMKTILQKDLVSTLQLAIQETTICYDELAVTFTRLQQQSREFVGHLKTFDISLDNIPSHNRAIYNISQIKFLCNLNLETELTKVASKRGTSSSKKDNEGEHSMKGSKNHSSLESERNKLVKAMQQSNLSHKCLSTSVSSALTCAIIAWQLLPVKQLSTITTCLLDAIELEEETILQDKSIEYMILLLDILCDDYNENKNLIHDILQKLFNILNQDMSNLQLSITTSDNIKDIKQVISSTIQQNKDINVHAKGTSCDIYRIVLLDNLQRKAEVTKNLTRRQSSITEASSLKRSHSQVSCWDPDERIDAIKSQEEIINIEKRNARNEIKVRGAKNTLARLVKHFGDQLPTKLPILWKNITQDIKNLVADSKTDVNLDEPTLIRNMRLLKVVGENLSDSLREQLLDIFQELIVLLSTSNPLIRHHSAECIGVISKLLFSKALESITENIVPMLEDTGNVMGRCGAIEAIAMIIEHLQLELVPKVDLFIIHVLRRMSDQNDQVRLLSTHCFGKLLSLIPLKLDKEDELLESAQKETNANFIEKLLNPKKLDNFELPMKIEAELRTYQQEGLNWLSFLNRFNLHGILCDEMGLGKTLMTICMVVSNFIISKKTSTSDKCLPSLIVCPSTLVEHWLYELHKFLPSDIRKHLNPASYGGTQEDRMIIHSLIIGHSSCQRKDITPSHKSEMKKSTPQINLIVASYENVRNNVDFFKEVNWGYCVLDEGHIIKNGKTKLSRAVRLITAKHRLILSGTPIQNNVTELWSLFDFLMPGFLGSDRQFNSKYAKPILQSREPKCSVRELEAGALAMESLHRQVLPFILRRTKEHVLSDLPPKIIQDYYCQLSPLQHKLYEDFTRSKLCNDVTKRSIQDLEESAESFEGSSAKKAESKGNVFQALQYLRNVCNHPKLVLTPKHPQFTEIKQSLETQKLSLDDLEHSSKLKALRQLLVDCGIGIQATGDEQTQQQQDLEMNSVVKQHRALVFCQLRSMVDIIENDLLLKYFPGTTYLKLNGSVPTHMRHTIVSRFNNDPSIDILLLTTQIGGLGLNLTGADTVIFVEHDWNPTKDLQAMDRAHRIGQKKVVNVYRLITKGTLEEKIMGLQKFKTMVSNTVINQDNSQAASCTMNVDQLFNLFEESLDNNKAIGGAGDKQQRGPLSGSGKSSFVDLLPELWDQQQYDTEYDLSSFVSSLKG